MTDTASRPAEPPLIVVRGLTKLYQMGDTVVRALDGVDLAIRRGEFVAITGASGSGKSTMMHLLGCLDRPTSGRFVLDGEDVGRMSDRQLADVRNRKIGFVFQTFNLIQRTTAVENVAVPLFYARQGRVKDPAKRALERVGLGKRGQHQPNELSGGERQRVAIARAIVNNPVLLMADEPTGNLDTRTGEQIMQIFHELNAQGVTIIMVTHEQEVAEQAQRIVHMRDGKIISDRLTADILAEEGRERPTRRTVAAEVEETERPDSPPTLDALPPRMVSGAMAGFWCSMLGAALLLIAVASQVALVFVWGDKLKELQAAAQSGQQVMPPMEVAVTALVTLVTLILAIALSVFGIVFSTGARKRARTTPGNWLGLRRALAGQIVGWVTVGLPVAGVLIGLIRAAAKAGT